MTKMWTEQAVNTVKKCELIYNPLTQDPFQSYRSFTRSEGISWDQHATHLNQSKFWEIRK